MQDPYIVLGVARNADSDEIKAAWRRAAKSAHPDRNPDDPDAGLRFSQIGRAYEVLKDPEKRLHYDLAHQAAQSRRKQQTFMEQRAQERARERAKAGAQAGGSNTNEKADGPQKEASQQANTNPFVDLDPEIEEAQRAIDPFTLSRPASARDLFSYLVRRLTRQIPAPQKAPDLAIEVWVSLEDIVLCKRQFVTLPDGRPLGSGLISFDEMVGGHFWER